MEASTRIIVALGRLKDRFLEFPDTLLSLEDVAGMLGLEPHQCQALLSALEDVRFLQRNAEGRYALRNVERATPLRSPTVMMRTGRRPIVAA